MELTLAPAYGRIYRSRADVLAAWHRGEDFQVLGLSHGRYCSERDAQRLRASGIRTLVFYGKQASQALGALAVLPL